ncbi:MAG TPA: hypothetical protein VGP18_06910 [Solirubrobacteraceae bacterium]|jgi:hypothetical protein|nr:hypothetical protein [Solirubrobacteraceae bacterium]
MTTPTEQPPRPRPPRVLEVGGKFDVEKKREETRSWIAQALVLLLIGTTAATVALIAAHDIKVNEALAMLGSLTAVVGTALGFYFGGHKVG